MHAFAFYPSSSPAPPAPVGQDLGILSPNPSPLRPPCSAKERIFIWVGVNTPIPPTLPHPILYHLDAMASHASLVDAASYGAGIRKFHIFCDVSFVPESARLPASLPILKSFALWALTDPYLIDFVLKDGTPFEPVSVTAVWKYLAAISAWHIAQGLPTSLSDGRPRAHPPGLVIAWARPYPSKQPPPTHTPRHSRYAFLSTLCP